MQNLSAAGLISFLLASSGKDAYGKTVKLSRKAAGYIAGLDYLSLAIFLFWGLKYGFVSMLAGWFIVRALIRFIALRMGAIVASSDDS